MITWTDARKASWIEKFRYCGLLMVANDGARIVAYNFHKGALGMERFHRYYAHGPAGTTDWLDSVKEAKTAYERMAKRRAKL